MQFNPRITTLMLLASSSAFALAGTLGTSFTYQGKLTDGGAPAQGTYDLRFTIYDLASGGSAIAGPQTNNAVAVSNGLFAVTLDFGASVFSGQAVWLEIAARTNGVGPFATFPVRQPLTSTPYALYAANAGTAAQANGVTAGTVSVSSLNTVGAPAPGQVLTYNGTQLAWMSLSGTGASWGLAGNSGTAPGTNFLGTTDNQPLDFRVTGQRAMRLEPTTNTANVIGGASNNFVQPGVIGATIAGGGSLASPYHTGNAPVPQLVFDNFCTLGGGLGNQADGMCSTVAGGMQNRIRRWTPNCSGSTIGGGTDNDIGSDSAMVGGGFFNKVYGSGSAIGGGVGNRVLDDASASTISGGCCNRIQTNSSFLTLDVYGYGHGLAAYIGGGFSNLVTGAAASVSAGAYNLALSAFAIVGGGQSNAAAGPGSFIGGGGWDGAAAAGNIAGGPASAIVGGWGNTIRSDAYGAVVGGGIGNTIEPVADTAVIAGGYSNLIQTPVWAGMGDSTISGGACNVIQSNAIAAAVGGGALNSAASRYGTVPGGFGNLAGGDYSFAGGRGARATQDGSFVWADSAQVQYDPYIYPQPGGISNSFNVRAQGGVYFATAIDDVSGQPTSGLYVSGGGSGWNTYCDRNAKNGFSDVDPREVLNQLASVPIKVWNYKTQGPSVRHLGPMAQDFNVAFGTGEADKTGEKKFINSIDADGVALAAIQGLNRKVEGDVAGLRAENAALKRELAEIRNQIKTLMQKP